MAIRLLKGLFQTLVRVGKEYIEEYKSEHAPIDARIAYMEKQISLLFWWKSHVRGPIPEGWISCSCPACSSIVKVPDNFCDYCKKRHCV